MIRKKKRRIKKAAIVLIPIVVLSAISLASIAYHPRASETTFAFEHYYGDSEYSGNGSEYDNIDLDNLTEDNTTVVEFEHTEETVEITDHETVELDRDPESITVLVNKELSLPDDYVPKDLVVPNTKFSITYYDEKKLMRKEAAEALEELFIAAEQEGYTLYGISAYRSYKRQYDIFTNNIKKKGFDHTLKYSAKPGYSEHQTGLAIDVSVKSIKNLLDSSFSNTPEGMWLDNNAHLYGYIIRYPENKTSITGYSYEPWHIRYVGVSLATYLYDNDLVLEEYYSFEPNIDFKNEIRYDNLMDFGIDIADVIEPKPPVVEEPIEEVVEDDKDSKDEDEDSKDSKDDADSEDDKDDGDSKDNKDDADSKDDNDDADSEDGNKLEDGAVSGDDTTSEDSEDLEDELEGEETPTNSEDGTSGSEQSGSATKAPTKAPTQTPSISPTGTPSEKPTVSPTVTPTPTKTQTVTLAPTIVPTDTSTTVTPTGSPSGTPTP